MERFLVVDDDPNITLALSRVLAALGYEVTEHNDPLEAAKEERFDVVITDFMMPHLNGVELLRRLKEKNPHAVRLLITAASDFKVAQEAVNRGDIFRLLSKPWQIADLRQNVHQAVEYHRLSSENRRLSEELRVINDELRQLNRTLELQVVERTNGLLGGLIKALDSRDTETQWHSRRVSRFTRRIAQEAGVTGVALEVIEQGAMLHDIGKIGVRDSVLLKPGPLTPDEWVEMRQHPEIGYRMLADIPFLKDAAEIVYQHQERWDGKGYPRGLAGEDIVVGARCFCIADTLDAITSDRPYRAGAPLEVALKEIPRLGGTQLDPHLVKLFSALPPSTWEDIREQIAQEEREEMKRFDGRPLITPAKALLGDWKARYAAAAADDA